MSVLRLILGIVIGIAAGIGVVMLGDMLNHRFFPPPPEVQVTNPQAIRDYMQTAPVLSLIGLPVTWTFAAFLGAFAAAKIGARRWAGWVAGCVLFSATGLNLVLIPHPLWMLIAAVVFVPAARGSGHNSARHGRRPKIFASRLSHRTTGG
jgi:MFS family permease